MVNMALYDHAMQKPCKRNDSIYFCAKVDFLGQQLTLSKKCKSVKIGWGKIRV
jgi:hypothetical protein